MSDTISIFDLLPKDDEMAKRFKPIKSTDWKWTMAEDYLKRGVLYYAERIGENED